jgi:hypothetical protein
MHPASHRTCVLIKDAINNLDTMRPINTVGRPGMVISHRCVDFTWLSCKFIVSCLMAEHRYLTGVPCCELYHSTLDVCMVNKVPKYHSMCKMVDSVYVAVETQQRIFC